MKKILFICFIFFSPKIFYGQEINSKERIKKIDLLIKVADSIGITQKEGIAEGEIKYNHTHKLFGWEAYFVNDNKNRPLRIKYSETNPKSSENLNFYYQNGEPIFIELIETPIIQKSKNNKQIIKQFYLDDNKIIFPDTNNSDKIYIIEKEKTIRKMIYH
jgi:hypothetical protein